MNNLTFKQYISRIENWYTFLRGQKGFDSSAIISSIKSTALVQDLFEGQNVNIKICADTTPFIDMTKGETIIFLPSWLFNEKSILSLQNHCLEDFENKLTLITFSLINGFMIHEALHERYTKINLMQVKNNIFWTKHSKDARLNLFFDYVKRYEKTFFSIINCAEDFYIEQKARQEFEGGYITFLDFKNMIFIPNHLYVQRTMQWLSGEKSLELAFSIATFSKNGQISFPGDDKLTELFNSIEFIDDIQLRILKTTEFFEELLNILQKQEQEKQEQEKQEQEKQEQEKQEQEKQEQDSNDSSEEQEKKSDDNNQEDDSSDSQEQGDDEQESTEQEEQESSEQGDGYDKQGSKNQESSSDSGSSTEEAGDGVESSSDESLEGSGNKSSDNQNNSINSTLPEIAENKNSEFSNEIKQAYKEFQEDFDSSEDSIAESINKQLLKEIDNEENKKNQENVFLTESEKFESLGQIIAPYKVIASDSSIHSRIERRLTEGDGGPKIIKEFSTLASSLSLMVNQKHTTGRPKTTGSRLIKSRIAHIATDSKIFGDLTSKKKSTGRPEVIILGDISGSTVSWFEDGKGEKFILSNLIINSVYSFFTSLSSARIPSTALFHTTHRNRIDDCLLLQTASYEMPTFITGESGIVNIKNARVSTTNTTTPLVKESFTYIQDCVQNSCNIDGVAIQQCGKLFTKANNTKLLIVLSDGQPSGGEYDGSFAIQHTINSIEELRKSGVHVISISLVEKVIETNDKIYGKNMNLNGSRGKLGQILSELARELVISI